MTDSRQSFDQIVHINTNVTRSCPICGKSSIGGDKFESGVNHLLSAHRGVVLHVGQETMHDDEHRPWQTTVAVLGVPEHPLAGAI